MFKQISLAKKIGLTPEDSALVSFVKLYYADKLSLAVFDGILTSKHIELHEAAVKLYKTCVPIPKMDVRAEITIFNIGSGPNTKTVSGYQDVLADFLQQPEIYYDVKVAYTKTHRISAKYLADKVLKYQSI